MAAEEMIVNLMRKRDRERETMNKKVDEILNNRTVIADLPHLRAYRYDGRIVINNEDDLEQVFMVYRKVYAKRPFVSVGIDLYWKEEKERK